jgi:hypothetical protein
LVVVINEYRFLLRIREARSLANGVGVLIPAWTHTRGNLSIMENIQIIRPRERRLNISTVRLERPEHIQPHQEGLILRSLHLALRRTGAVSVAMPISAAATDGHQAITTRIVEDVDDEDE